MERGVWLIVLCVLAISVSAANESVGTFKKGPGDSWMVDTHQASIVKSGLMDDSLIYFSFDEITRSINLHECSWFKNYQVCFTNSTLGSNFSYEWGTTPYVYWLKISAETAKVSIDATASDTKMVLGQSTRINIGVRNTGQVGIEEMNFSTDVSGFSVANLRGPCTATGSRVVWQGRLFMEEYISCWFELKPLMTKTLDLKPTATYYDGRKVTTSTGKSVKIEAKGDIMKMNLGNLTPRLDEWVKGNITLDNTFSGKQAYFKGTLKAQGAINGTTSFDEMVPEGKVVSKSFLVHMTRTGNNSVTLSGSYRVDGQPTPVTVIASTIVSQPRLKLSFFGDREVPPNASARIEVEGENQEKYTLSNLQAVIEVANVSQTPGIPIKSLTQSKKEQLYFATIQPAQTSTVVATVSYDTPFGERVQTQAKTTLTVTGTKPATPTKTTPPKTGTTSTSTTGTNGTTNGTSSGTKPAATKTTTPQEPALGKTNLILLAVVIGVVGIAGLWLVLQSKKSSEE